MANVDRDRLLGSGHVRCCNAGRQVDVKLNMLWHLSLKGWTNMQHLLMLAGEGTSTRDCAMQEPQLTGNVTLGKHTQHTSV